MTFPYAYYNEKYTGTVHGSGFEFSYQNGFYPITNGAMFSIANSPLFAVDSEAFRSYRSFQPIDGTVTSPAYSFNSAKNVGFFRKANSVGYSCKGAEHFEFTDLGTFRSQNLQLDVGRITANTVDFAHKVSGKSTVKMGALSVSSNDDDVNKIPNEGAAGNGYFAGSVKAEEYFIGTATSAQYADLAERYEVDEPVVLGELVSIGGEKEITKTKKDLDPDFFGVVSEDPAFRMNDRDKYKGKDSHPFVAFSGRLPCLVVGTVKKGQRLVPSTLAGVARAAEGNEHIDYRPIVGRALKDKTDPKVGLLEIVVGKL